MASPSSLRSLLGTEITYRFPPTDDEDLIYTIEDSFPRSRHFSDPIREDEQIIDAREGTLTFTLWLDEFETIEELEAEIANLEAQLTQPVLSDGKCLANCGYHAAYSGFCSIHQKYKSEDHVAAHTNWIKNQISNRLDNYRELLLEPLPEEFEEEYSTADKTVKIKFIRDK